MLNQIAKAADAECTILHVVFTTVKSPHVSLTQPPHCHKADVQPCIVDMLETWSMRKAPLAIQAHGCIPPLAMLTMPLMPPLVQEPPRQHDE